jgi:SAM-dependent methyltransferase
MSGERHPASDSPSENALALDANVTAFNEASDQQLIAASPHLKHSSLRRLHRALVAKVIDRTGLDAPAASVLELGAGGGLGSVPWFEAGVRQIVALDPSPLALEQFIARAASYGVVARGVCVDAQSYLVPDQEQFDIVSFGSVLHHIPDYRTAVTNAIRSLRPGGGLLIFQDPLRFDTMPTLHHRAHRVAYLAWRIPRGRFRQGIRTQLRRLRGTFSKGERSDYEEYHAVRNGVDSDALLEWLRPRFERVEEFCYWSTPGAMWQFVGERLGFKTEFSIVATGLRR